MRQWGWAFMYHQPVIYLSFVSNVKKIYFNLLDNDTKKQHSWKMGQHVQSRFGITMCLFCHHLATFPPLVLTIAFAECHQVFSDTKLPKQNFCFQMWCNCVSATVWDLENHCSGVLITFIWMTSWSLLFFMIAGD